MKFTSQVVLLCLTAILVISPSTFAAEKTGKLRHVVAFKFNDGASAQQIKQVEDAFRALKKKIPQIAGLEWGTNMSPEKLNKGFTHCFIVTFKSEKDRDEYLPHPEHKAFVEVLKPVMADAFVIDR
jgi:hypothetical protein